MIQKFMISLFAALFLLSGCSSSIGKNNRHNIHENEINENQHIVEFERLVGDMVFFDFDSAGLSQKAQNTLNAQAKWLTHHPAFSITIEGHCDERGTREYNIALGARRAESIKRFLVNSGISESRIETISYGKERPAVIGNNEEAFSKNRRGVTAIR